MSRQPYCRNFSSPYPSRQPFCSPLPPPHQFHQRFHPPQQFAPPQPFAQQQWCPPGQQHFQQQQQQLYQLQQGLQPPQQQYQRGSQNQRPPRHHYPNNPPGHAPVYRGSGSGSPASGGARLASSSSSSYSSPISCSQPRAGIAPPHHDGHLHRPSTNQPPLLHPLPTQPGAYGAPVRYPPTSRGRDGGAENDDAVTGCGRGKSRSSCSAGEVLPGHFPQRGCGGPQPGVQASAPPATQGPSSALSPLPSHQGRGQSARLTSPEPPRGLPGQVHAATREIQSQQQQQQQQKMPQGKHAAPLWGHASSWHRKETSPRSPEVAEPKAKKAKGKGVNRKAGNKGLSKKDKEREDTRRKMLEHVLRIFPDMHRQPCIVPPVRILDKLKCTQLEQHSVHNYSVVKQPEIQEATLLGYQTEDTVTRWLANVVNSTMDEAVFLLSNYEFDDYLCHLRVKPKGGGGGGNSNNASAATTTTTTKDDHDPDRKTTGDSLDATTGPGNAVGKTDCSEAANSGSQNAAEGGAAADPEKRSPADACGQAATPASGPSPPTCLFPSPDDLGKNARRGDFDGLIVSPKYGFIIVESKSMIGIDPSEAQPESGSGSGAEADLTAAGQANEAEAEAGSRRPVTQDEDFRNTIRKALKQLRKEDTVLLHLISDLTSGLAKEPPVTKLMAFPNKSKEDLRHLLEDRELFQDCCDTLGTRTLEEALSRCITSDLINDPILSLSESRTRDDDEPREETDRCLSPGQQWWRAFIADVADRNSASRGEMATACAMDVGADGSGGVEKEETTAAFSLDLFDEIIGRFCGPFSRVPGRTVPDCIHLTGVLCGRSVLQSHQLDVLESKERFLLIKGPPGCGKTLLLGLKAAEWARQGDQVVIVCSEGVNYGSLVSWTLHQRVVSVMKTLKRRELRKAKDAADAAAAADAAVFAVAPAASEGQGGGSGEAAGDVASRGGGGDSGDVPTKDAKMKTSSPRRQAKKKNKNRQPTLSSSSSEGAGGPPDRTSAESETCAPQKDNSRNVVAGQHGNPSDGAVEPQSRSHQTRPDDGLSLGDITVENVHLERISSETNVEEFVSELLDKYGKGNLRIILDESPKKHEKNYIPNTLNLARGALDKMIQVYESLLETFKGRIKELCYNGRKSQKRPRSETGEERSLSPVEEAERRTESEGGKPNGHSENSDNAVSKPNPCLIEQKDSSLDHGKQQNARRSAERPKAKEEEKRGNGAGEKPVNEGTISKVNAENAAVPQSKRKLRLEVKKETSQVEEEDKAEILATQPPVTSPSSKQFKADDYFTTMNNRMRLLAKRFQLVLAGMSVLEWNDAVLDMFKTYEKVRGLSKEAAGMTECCIAEDEVVLEELKGLMVSVMGYMFGVSNALSVFKVHQFLSVITTSPHSTPPPSSLSPPPRHDAAQTPFFEPSLPQGPSAASETQDTSQAGTKVAEKAEEESVALAASIERTGTLQPPPESASNADGLSQTTEDVAQAGNASNTGSASLEDETSLPSAELSVWVTTVYPEDMPSAYIKAELTRSLRCTPNVQKILKWTEADVKTQIPPGYNYITRACDVNPPLPSDGPPVKWFDHGPHATSYPEVNDCPECGEALVNYLVNTLGLKHMTEAQERARGQRGKKKQDDEPQLYFHDVVISGSPIHQPDCAFMQKLKNQDIDVLYENHELKGPPPYTNNILVIGGSVMQGLETKIAIYVPELKRITAEEKAEAERMTSSSTVKEDDDDEEEEGYSEEDRIQLKKLKRMGTWNRDYLYMVASRSLSQLIIFH